MRQRLGALLFVGLTLLMAAPPALAGDKEDVAAAAVQWTKLFVDDNPDPILALYAKDAVLWGTLSPTRRETPAALREYFVGAYVKDGQAQTIPARYSFVYVKQGGKWLIVDHHSSAMPAPPR
jgi:hypothetical protein